MRGELPRRFDAVHVRQLKVHQDHVRHVLVRERDPFRGPAGSEHPEPGRGQDVEGELPVPVVVVDDEDAGHGRILAPWVCGW